MKNYLILALVFLFFIACNKDDKGTTYKIKGQVVEYGTEVPVANALVYATGYQEDNSVVFLDSTRSDANGEYKLTVTGFAVAAYAEKDGYDGRNSEEPVDAGGAYRNLTLVLDPYAWLDVTLKNVSGAEVCHYSLYNLGGDLQMGLNDTFSFSGQVYGNREILVGIGTTTSSNGYTDLTQLVYCTGHETTYFYYEY